ncbi:MAG: lysylphosphatidylglycerol synthase transmembrane domain-containing protein [Pirellulaceae bacterium]
MKKVLVTLAKYGISILILYWLFQQAKQADQFDVLWSSEKRYGWLIFAVFTGVGTALVSFYRWYLLVRALGLEFSYYDAVRLGFLGNLLNLMSIGVLGGDAIKAVFLARQMPGRAPEAVASVIFDRAIGLLAMFSFASVAYLITDFSRTDLLHATENAALHWVCRFTILFTIIGFIGLSVLFLMPRFRESAIYKRLGNLPRVGRLFKRLVNVALTYRSRFGSVVAAFLLSIVVNLGFATTFFSIASGLSDQHPTYAQHLVISPIAMVANAVPLPGGLGGMEAAVNYLYRAFSSAEIPTEHGFVVALGFRMILFITAGIGLVFYITSKREIRELSETDMTLASTASE